MSDEVSITDLSLTSSILDSDLWGRPFTPQPLLLSFQIQTSIASEALLDALLPSSINYSSVSKSVIRSLTDLDTQGKPMGLSELAERIAEVILESAPNVALKLVAPRAFLGAESVSVEIYREKEGSDRGVSEKNKTSTKEDLFAINNYRKHIVIGIHPFERLEPQEILLNLTFPYPPGTSRSDNMRSTNSMTPYRLALQSLQPILSSQPLTIESLVLNCSKSLLQPGQTGFDIKKVGVKISKPVAVSMAKSPSVGVLRRREDFWEESGVIKTGLEGLERVGGASNSTLGVGKSANETSSNLTSGNTAQTTDQSSSTHQNASSSPQEGTTVYIALGTNVGSLPYNLKSALTHLVTPPTGSLKIKTTSFIYESLPMYHLPQSKFLNAAICVSTTLTPIELLDHCKSIEDKMGRVKGVRNGPRVVDLDILAYGDLVGRFREQDEERWLEIPHPLICEREFVLRPFADIAPDFIHPKTNKSIAHHLEDLERSAPSELKQIIPLSDKHYHTLDSRTLFMYIVNTTPDSFSDGGKNASLDLALESVRKAVLAGVDILDIGGMSSAPTANWELDSKEEISRTVSLIKAIREEGIETPISIDTFRPEVARAAIGAGADIINDIMGGAFPEMKQTMAELNVPVIIMHSRGEGSEMHSETLSKYKDVESEVRDELEARLREVEKHGVSKWNLVSDVGIGFSKRGEENLAVLRGLSSVLGRANTSPKEASNSRLTSDGFLSSASSSSSLVSSPSSSALSSASSDSSATSVSDSSSSHSFLKPQITFSGPQSESLLLPRLPTLVGLSRKKFLGTIISVSASPAEMKSPLDRIWATSAGVSASIANGADIVRCHDLEMMDVVKVSDAIWKGRRV